MTKSKWLNSLIHTLKKRTEQILTRINGSPLFIKIMAKAKKNRTLRLLAFVEQEQLRMGIEGVLNHKLRSLLTTLGIIFGVAAVISMLAIGEGARRKTLSQIQSLGLQNIIIEQQELSDDESNEQDAVDLNFGDMQAVKKIISSPQAVVPVIERDFTAS
ncbi:MAG: ABC transporter permease [Calditrichales bacterium]|nr:ABC transporter permease [Calditrichales bacterium]